MRSGEIHTKAQTLAFLTERLIKSKVLPVFVVRRAKFAQQPEQVLRAIQSTLPCGCVIVRSSSVQEDSVESSNAGKFQSVLNVPITDYDAVKRAIQEVFDSYENDEGEDEVLIQPMLCGVIRSGVAFTRDVYTGAPYFTINFSEGQDTAAVTGGRTNELKTLVVLKSHTGLLRNPWEKELIEALFEVEQILGSDALDVEFAFTGTDLYILQARPIVAGGKNAENAYDLVKPLEKLYKKVEKLMRPHPFLLGERNCFGVMPDWNPAEILGVRPKKLAISLYKELVTDSIWAHQRDDYGYLDLTMHPLMVSFCGIPYIDTRVTFNSFIPKSLNKRIAEKLVNYYIDTLRKYPAYHDKIEFEIVYSCYYIGLAKDLRKLLQRGFNENELKRIEFSLLNLTNQIIHPDTGLYKKDIKKADELFGQYRTIMESGISIIDKIYWLLKCCKKYGTLPFAGVARAGFIAVQFLRSFVMAGLMTQEEYDAFMQSLNTVSKQLSTDRFLLQSGRISREAFLEKYGHIRPGTYDILSERYDENFDFYFGAKGINTGPTGQEKGYSFSEEQLTRLDMELEQNGLTVNAKQLLRFIQEAIEAREAVKFQFTRCVSEVLRLIGDLGKRSNIPLEDMAHLDITVIKQLYVDLYYGDLRNILIDNIAMNRKQYNCARQIKLPSVIIKPEDVYCFTLLEDEPNFVTLNRICASVVKEADISHTDVTGKIVFIRSADPGYDYLFSKQIGGLITQFGGANSHMTIRCAELGVPAVIGAGEKNYTTWESANILSVDCGNRQVIIEQ